LKLVCFVAKDTYILVPSISHSLSPDEINAIHIVFVKDELFTYFRILRIKNSRNPNKKIACLIYCLYKLAVAGWCLFDRYSRFQLPILYLLCYTILKHLRTCFVPLKHFQVFLASVLKSNWSGHGQS